MQLPASAIFAFNANIDYLRHADGQDLAAIEGFSPQISSQISESFAYGMQKEIVIDEKACDFFLKEMKFDQKMVGGQAGNAAQQASSLGIDCFLHSNFPNEELLGLFSRPEKILVAGEKGFVPADKFSSHIKSAHHFVFENRENRTRFIASYDPFPLHPEDNFCFSITGKLPEIGKAFVGGLHLVRTPDRLRKFASEIKRWKEAAPRLKVFLELGEFQSKDVLKAVEKDVFPLVDILGLNDTELATLSYDLEELPEHVGAVLFHSPREQLVLPNSALNAAALEFARRAASFRAKTGRFATPQDLVGFASEFVESPVETVGLGDAFSCAYFMCTP